MRLPEEAPPPAPEKRPKPISETHTVTRSDGVPSSEPGFWPCFRGPNRDGVSRERVDLARKWAEDGPPVLWKAQLGPGHAGAAVRDGRVYILDYDDAAARDALRCLSLDDGREIWRFSYPVVVTGQYGKSRTVPAVSEQHVVSFGPRCHVTCVDSKTGEFRWGFDLASEFGANIPQWGAGQCPLIDGERAIIAVGGDALLMAVECATGRIAWKAPNPKRWRMTHSSVVAMEFKGQRMFVYCASGGVVGVAADDGRILWENTEWIVSFANVPSPIPFEDGRIFLSGGYGAGSMMMRLDERDGGFVATVLYRLPEATFGAEQHTPILYDGHLYGTMVDGRFACLDPAGTVVWATDRRNRFGRGPFVLARGLLYILNDDSGVLTLIEATPLGYRELARAKVIPGPKAYAPMAVAGGRLILRDQDGTMVCLDVRRQ